MNLTLGMVVIGILAIIGGIWMLARRMRQVGETKVVADVATATVEAQSKMADAAANAPQGKAAVIARLRNGGGL